MFGFSVTTLFTVAIISGAVFGYTTVVLDNFNKAKAEGREITDGAKKAIVVVAVLRLLLIFCFTVAGSAIVFSIGRKIDRIDNPPNAHENQCTIYAKTGRVNNDLFKDYYDELDATCK